MAREETVTMLTFMLAVAPTCGKVLYPYLGAESQRSIQYCLGLSCSRRRCGPRDTKGDVS